ncbi:MAG: type II toxin-antitoxin system Phd/YefM family antitoxin [Oscillospiraceae bacterium]|nr:type II toxin-antitoxin system Phd/YefM family antitoxin [Oscillospiraceae bacterium]
MFIIQIRPVRDLRNNYTEVESMLEKRNPVIKTKNWRSSAVLFSIQDFEEYEEFLHTRYVAQKLREAEIEAQLPGAQWYDYKEVLDNLREKYNGL